MTYATGRLNEGLYTLYARTRAELTSLAGPTHPLSAYATTKELQNDITRILDILDKQASGVQADTFVLRNLVANGFDVSGCVEEVQEKGSQIIFFVCGGIFATYLGVPWAISIPSTVLVSGAGFVFHHFRWTAAQDRFISRVSETQKILEARLMEAYDKEFTRVVSDPLALIVKMLSGAVEKSGEEAKKVLEEVDGLIKEIDDTSK
ncbi:hypothetical protein BC830DRAFT_841071 [Chytriomyces sp. MP71]|nr:hypothetical protein BC830DRAFT_841071 [Chytriomyces sp. MP71]